jgi:Methane oxygenase PmoA
MVTRLVDRDDRAVSAVWQDTEIFRYVYAPTGAQVESPRPYFHPMRTLRGDVVTGYRPRDHVWHKGMSWSLPNVGSANFWGGPTYRRGRGYRQLRNNGRMRHDGFRAVRLAGGVARLEEDLSWVTEQGNWWFGESRRIAALVWPGERAWMLAFESTLRNVSGVGITLGSPTT